MTLKEYLKGRKCQGFQPVPCFFPEMNMFWWYWKDEPCYSEPVHVEGVCVGSLHRSLATGEVVGVTVHGVNSKGDFPL
jgi:hypothetical protein